MRWSLLLILAGGMFGMATFSTLAPIYARDELGLGADGYGAFLGAAGAGALTAALLVTTFAHGDRRPWLIVGVLAMAGLVGGIALAASVDVVFVLAFLLGAAQITLAQNALVSVHSATPDAAARPRHGPLGDDLPGVQPVRRAPLGLAGRRPRGRLAMLVGALALAASALVALVAIRRVTWRLTPAGAAA